MFPIKRLPELKASTIVFFDAHHGLLDVRFGGVCNLLCAIGFREMRKPRRDAGFVPVPLP